MLRKSGEQLFMDEIDRLTTNEARHTDLAEIGNVGQSEVLSTCELLGGRTLQISPDTGCDLLTREGSSRAQTTVRQFAGSEFLVRCGVRGGGVAATAATKQTRSCTKDEGWFEPR